MVTVDSFPEENHKTLRLILLKMPWYRIYKKKKYILISRISSTSLPLRLLKVKVKDVPELLLTEHHTMKAYWGSGSIAPSILDLGTRWR
jgi:hypothetical protein